jgi:hypothetical protein
MRDISTINISPVDPTGFHKKMLLYLEERISKLRESVNSGPVKTDTGKDITEHLISKIRILVEIKHFVEKEMHSGR